MNWLTALSSEQLAAVSAFGGAIAGALAAVIGQVTAAFVTASLADRRQNRLDEPRKQLLKYLLENRPKGTKWRSMKTLSRAIGASEEETARLLITIGARGSLTESPSWGLISVVGYPKSDTGLDED